MRCIQSTVALLCCALLSTLVAHCGIAAEGMDVQVPQGKLRIATCQFPVSADMHANGEWIRRQMRKAHQKGAELVHFSECAEWLCRR